MSDDNANPGELALDLKKKKKPKKTELELDPADDNGDGEQLILDLKKKKKTKKADAKKTTQVEDEQAIDTAAFELGKSNLVDAKSEWPDYQYDELLSMVFGIMREKNPDLGGDQRRFVMKPPQVARAGSKKTAFTNYAEICKLLKRLPKHVLQFILAELGTTGSIDGNQCLIVKGRFQQKHFENVLRKYIKEYVTCHTCRSADTDLIRDTRLFFLQCKTCGSRCSVTPIKSGFTAMVGKRAAIRRAAEATGGQK